MANSYNTQPIRIDTDMTNTTTWRESQTLNVGNIPATAQNSGVTRQWGIRVTSVVITPLPLGTPGAGVIQFLQPDGTVLLTVNLVQNVYAPIVFDFQVPKTWKDFYVTGLTASGYEALIYYRA